MSDKVVDRKEKRKDQRKDQGTNEINPEVISEEPIKIGRIDDEKHQPARDEKSFEEFIAVFLIQKPQPREP